MEGGGEERSEETKQGKDKKLAAARLFISVMNRKAARRGRSSPTGSPEPGGVSWHPLPEGRGTSPDDSSRQQALQISVSGPRPLPDIGRPQ